MGDDDNNLDRIMTDRSIENPETLSTEIIIPAHHMRKYPFPGKKKFPLEFLDRFFRHPTLFGLGGLGIYGTVEYVKDWLGYSSIFDFSAYGQDSFQIEPIVNSFPFLELASWFLIPFGMSAVAKSIAGSLSSYVYEETGFFEEFPDDVQKKDITHIDKFESRLLNLSGQAKNIFSDRKTTIESFEKAVDINPYDLHSLMCLCELGLMDYASGEKGISSLFQRCNSFVNAARISGSRAREAYHLSHSDVLQSLRTKYTLKSMVDRKNLGPKLIHLCLDLAYGSYDKLINRIDDIMNYALKEASYHEEGSIKEERIGDKSMHALFANFMRTVSVGSREFRKGTNAREKWFWEQMFLEARYDTTTQLIPLGESKNITYKINIKIDDDSHVGIKQFPEIEAGRGEIALTKKINEAVLHEELFITPRPISFFEYADEKDKSYIYIMSLLNGKSFYDKIMDNDLLIRDHARDILEFMAIIYAKISPDDFPDFNLKKRDVSDYLCSWADEAHTSEVFRMIDIEEASRPWEYAHKDSLDVVSIDPHAGNFQCTESGKIGKLDNELTRIIDLESELVKFFELIPYDRSMKVLPASYGHPDIEFFIGNLNKGLGKEEKIKFNDRFYKAYLNSIIEMGISLYSPYSVRTTVSMIKKNLLLKSLKSLEIIKHDYSSLYAKFNKEYKMQDCIITRMIERNGFSVS